MKLLHFTTVRLAICLILGIVFGFYTDTGWRIPLILTLVFVSALGMLRYFPGIFPHLWRHWPYLNGLAKQAFGIAAFLSFFLVGWLSLSLHQEKNQWYHYSNYINPGTENVISFQIRKTLKPGMFYNRYEAKTFNINNKKASGTLLLNIKKDTASQPLNVDERYTVKALLHGVKPPLNPHQFNYKDYLEKRHIYHQLYTASETLYQLPEPVLASVYGMASSLRKQITNALQKHGFKGDELAVINALLLGQRQDISKEVYTHYTNAGAIHILAVSGLHVGIILLIINFLLKPLERFKHGKKLKLLLVVLLLWVFALIAGLSASVVRAVTMFSFIAWAFHIKRSVNIYNILAVSILFLLLIKPLFVFDVGFQLSYSAVFAIVWLQPMIYNRWKPRYKAPDLLWKLLTVSLAAQCGVAPLSLYYFHQFPGLFFISNLVIIPVLGIILGFGILVIVLALLNGLPAFLVAVYEFIIAAMNTFIHWVAQQESFLIKDISFDSALLFTVYLALISGVLMLKKPKFSRITFFLIAILMLQGVFIFNSYTTGHQQRFVIFHKNRNTVIGEQQGAMMKLYAFDKELTDDHIIKNYRVAERIHAVTQESLRDIYVVGGKRLLRIDSLGVYRIPRLQPDYILLCNSPKINLERLISEIKPTAIIADGSNYKSDIRRWSVTCKQQNIPFHTTGAQGAFMVED